MHDPIDTESQEQQAREAAQASERKQRQAVEDLKWQLAHKPGRRQAWRLLSSTGVFRNPFHQESAISAFNAGQMNVGQKLLADIMTHCPDAFTLMLKEAAEPPAPRRTDEAQE